MKSTVRPSMFIPTIMTDGDWEYSIRRRIMRHLRHETSEILIMLHYGHMLFKDEGSMPRTFSSEVQNIISTTSFKYQYALLKA